MVANLQFLRDAPIFYAEQQELNSHDPATDYKASSSPLDWQSAYTPLSEDPSFEGQEDESTWSWLPVLNFENGLWQYSLWDNNLTPYPPYLSPLDLDVTENCMFNMLIFLMHLQYPAFAPQFLTPISTGLYGDNTISFTAAHSVEVTVTDGGDTDKWYGATGVGKYGWLTEQYEDGSFGALEWINFTKRRYRLKQN